MSSSPKSTRYIAFQMMITAMLGMTAGRKKIVIRSVLGMPRSVVITTARASWNVKPAMSTMAVNTAATRSPFQNSGSPSIRS